MRLSPRTAVVLALLSSGIALAPVHAAHTSRRPTLRVLFIGNSYTRFNDLPGMVRSVAESVPDGPRVQVARVTRSGASLRRHWNQRRARRRLSNGEIDVVVLQGHSMAIRHADEMREYTQRFARQAGEAGARLVLFETWARRSGHPVYRHGDAGRNPQEMLQRVDALYCELGARVGANVSPVGRAWLRALEMLPRTTLHREDGTHPAVAGSYLSALVLYGTLTSRDPRVVRWRHWQVPPRTAEGLRLVAAETLHE